MKKSQLKYEEKKGKVSDNEQQQPGIHQGNDDRSSVWSTNNVSALIPGFSIIKNKVITPLLVATEKVVDMIINDNESAANKDQAHIFDNQSMHSSRPSSLQDHFSTLALSESQLQNNRLKRKRRYQ